MAWLGSARPKVVELASYRYRDARQLHCLFRLTDGVTLAD